MKEVTGRLQDLPEEASLEAEQVDDSHFHGQSQQKGAAADDLARLHEISTSLIRERNVAVLYERVLDGAISLMSADMGSIQIFDRKRGELKLIASRGFHPESTAFWEWVRPSSGSTSGHSLSSGGRVIVSDVETCAFMASTAGPRFISSFGYPRRAVYAARLSVRPFARRDFNALAGAASAGR